jgi:predicted XRE-type DNA-binding protein
MDVKEKKRYLQRYRWSSYFYYGARGKRNSLLNMQEILGYFGGNNGRGRRNYEKFVVEGLEGGITSPLEKGKGHGVVGNEDFVERVRDRFLKKGMKQREVPAVRGIIGQVAPAKILGVVSRETGVSEEELQKRGERGVGRGLLMEMLYRYGGLNQRQIGEMMGVDYSSVSVARKRFQLLCRREKQVLGLMERVQKKISQG